MNEITIDAPTLARLRDKHYFEQHPGETYRLREYIPGEFEDQDDVPDYVAQGNVEAVGAVLLETSGDVARIALKNKVT